MLLGADRTGDRSRSIGTATVADSQLRQSPLVFLFRTQATCHMVPILVRPRGHADNKYSLPLNAISDRIHLVTMHKVLERTIFASSSNALTSNVTTELATGYAEHAMCEFLGFSMLLLAVVKW